MTKALEKNKAVKGSGRDGGGLGAMLFYTGWSEKAILSKWHLSKDLKEVREGTMQIPGGRASRPREQPVQRP